MFTIFVAQSGDVLRSRAEIYHGKGHMQKLLMTLIFIMCTAIWPVKCKDDLPALIQRVKPAVVTIYVYNEYNTMINQGSGFFLSPELVVSSRHVFWKKGATHAKVVTNKLTAEYAITSVIADDVETDLVLLGVDRGHNKVSQLSLNVSFDELLEGEDVFVISSPSGLTGVISTGIVSSIHNEYDVQISCPISTGSSGAPIFNFKGEVVGVVVGHFNTGQNLNFGISVQGLSDLVKKLEKETITTTTINVIDPREGDRQVIEGDRQVISPPLMLPSPDTQDKEHYLYPTIQEWIENAMPKENTTTSIGPFSLVDLWSGLKNLTKGFLNWESVCTENQKQSHHTKLRGKN